MGNTFERQTDKINNFELDISDDDFKEICDKFIQIYFFKDFKILLDDYIKGCEDIREKLKPKKIVIFPGDSPSKIYLYLKNTSSEEKKKNMINFSLSGMKYFKIENLDSIEKLNKYFEKKEYDKKVKEYIFSKLPSEKIENYSIVDMIQDGKTCFIINAIIQIKNNEINSEVVKSELNNVNDIYYDHDENYFINIAKYFIYYNFYAQIDVYFKNARCLPYNFVDDEYNQKYNKVSDSPLNCNIFVYIGIQYSKNKEKTLKFLNESYENYRKKQISKNDKHYLIEFSDKISNISSGNYLKKDFDKSYYINNDGVFCFNNHGDNNIEFYDSNLEKKVEYGFPFIFKDINIVYTSLYIIICVYNNYVCILKLNIEFNSFYILLKITATNITTVLFSENYLFLNLGDCINVYKYDNNKFTKIIDIRNPDILNDIDSLTYYNNNLFYSVNNNFYKYEFNKNKNYKIDIGKKIEKKEKIFLSKNKLFIIGDKIIIKSFDDEILTETYDNEIKSQSFVIDPDNDFIIIGENNYFRMYDLKKRKYIISPFLNYDIDMFKEIIKFSNKSLDNTVTEITILNIKKINSKKDGTRKSKRRQRSKRKSKRRQRSKRKSKKRQRF